MMNEREIMEKVIRQEYQRRWISAAKKNCDGCKDGTIKQQIEAAEKKLNKDMEALDRILEGI